LQIKRFTSVETIRLEAGTYVLVDVNNTTDGANGLPLIVRRLTITGAGVDLTTIERNVTTHLFRLGHVATTGTLTLDGLTIQGFSPSNSGGGAGPGGALNNQGTLTVSNAAVRNNSAFYGGSGLYNSGRLTLSNTTIAHNGGRLPGGGLANAGGTVRISQSTIAGNTAQGGGCGIYNAQHGTLTLTNTAVINNGGLCTGGLANVDGSVTITNSTFAGNRSPSTGGLSNGGMLTLVNTTVAENSGSFIGGLSSTGTTVLVNTILARNIAQSDGGSPDCEGAITSQGNNLIGEPSGCTITLLPGASDLTGDPGLDAFTDDETPGNGHFPLLLNSQAINAGNPAVCPKTDQLGEKRDKLCDIGAIEFQGTAVSSQ
jgi:hypothetical protein